MEVETVTHGGGGREEGISTMVEAGLILKEKEPKSMALSKNVYANDLDEKNGKIQQIIFEEKFTNPQRNPTQLCELQKHKFLRENL